MIAYAVTTVYHVRNSGAHLEVVLSMKSLRDSVDVMTKNMTRFMNASAGNIR